MPFSSDEIAEVYAAEARLERPLTYMDVAGEVSGSLRFRPQFSGFTVRDDYVTHLEVNRRWRRANRPHINAYQRWWREKRRHRRRVGTLQVQRWRAAHPERYAEQKRRRVEQMRRKGTQAAYMREWRARHRK